VNWIAKHLKEGANRWRLEQQGERCCSRCGARLRLVDVIPQFGDGLKIRILECPNCD